MLGWAHAAISFLRLVHVVHQAQEAFCVARGRTEEAFQTALCEHCGPLRFVLCALPVIEKMMRFHWWNVCRLWLPGHHK